MSIWMRIFLHLLPAILLVAWSVGWMLAVAERSLSGLPVLLR